MKIQTSTYPVQDKRSPVRKAKIYEDSTHLYKFYSFKFIEFKPKFFKFEGPQSLQTIQRRYNYNNYSLHQSSKGILAEKLIPIWTEESFLQISTLTLLQIIPIHDMDNSLSQISLKKTSTHFIKIQL